MDTANQSGKMSEAQTAGETPAARKDCVEDDLKDDLKEKVEACEEGEEEGEKEAEEEGLPGEGRGGAALGAEGALPAGGLALPTAAAGQPDPLGARVHRLSLRGVLLLDRAQPRGYRAAHPACEGADDGAGGDLADDHRAAGGALGEHSARAAVAVRYRIIATNGLT